MTAHSTRIAKPNKPRTDFPLFPHANGRWCKKCCGAFAYFGKWADDPKGEAALRLWNEQRDELLAGRKQRDIVAANGALTIADLVNRFLNHKQSLVETGELKPGTWQGYYVACERVVKEFGRNRVISSLAAEDFAKLRKSFAATHGPRTLAADVIQTRVLFKFGFDEGLIDAPIRYGQSFDVPSEKTIRIAKAKAGPRMFEKDELHAMLNAVKQPLRVMLLLGLNTAFGNNDVATLPIKAIDLKTGWITFARPKTGVDRRIPLWNETRAALEAWLAIRPAPKDPSLQDRVFLTPRGRSWERGEGADPVTRETGVLLRRIGLQQSGRNFYSLRRTFRTIASDALDEPAADSIMGHTRNDMASVYRQRISDDRLRAVVEHVRGWLFGVGDNK